MKQNDEKFHTEKRMWNKIIKSFTQKYMWNKMIKCFTYKNNYKKHFTETNVYDITIESFLSNSGIEVA